MNLKKVAKAYIVAVLIAGTVVSPLPQMALALILLATQVVTVYKPLTSKNRLAVTFITLLLTPLAFSAIIGDATASLLIIPQIYLLDQDLRENSQNQQLVKSQKRMGKATLTLTSLAAASSSVFAVSLLLRNETLVYTTLIAISYVSAALTYNMLRIPKTPLKENKIKKRTLMGKTEKTQITLSAETKLPINITVASPQPWIQVEPSYISLSPKSQAQISITYTPPLAGPTKIQLQTTSVDPRGLIQINQTIEAIDLNVIPRAKYALWLARKYLQQTASGTASFGSASPPKALKATKRGIEFYGSRSYQPGDRLKEIDWKHTVMLDEIIVKEFTGAHGAPVLLVADLTAKDEQSADRLVYNLVMAALTAAVEAVPAGLACYNQNEVLVATAPINPRETLKKTLQLTEKVAVAEPPLKVTQPIELCRLKKIVREISQKERAGRLKETLELEIQSTQMTSKIQPATLAITKSAKQTPIQAMIAVASGESGDSEALMLALEPLKTRGYNIVIL
ncbi:MAG: DUF58 domain-containing protein [Candidatus Bathyarchaeia archaeon]